MSAASIAMRFLSVAMDKSSRAFWISGPFSPVFAKAVHVTPSPDLGRCSYSDNYFDLLPNTKKTNLLETGKEVALDNLEKMLKVGSL